MALKQIKFNIAAFNDSEAGGNNYFVGKIFEIYNTNDTLADIFSDAAGSNPINQDGIQNVSDASGRCSFYIEEGSYYIKVGTYTENFTIDSLIGDLSVISSFDTAQDYENSSTAFPTGKFIRIGDRNSIFKVVTGVTANSFSAITNTSGVIIADTGTLESPNSEGFGAGFGRAFIQRINGRVDDVYMLIQGDSTGDATDEWPYLTAVKLASLYPEHSVKFRFWNDTTKDYDSEVTISTGTGSYTIYIYNASRAGGSIPIYTGSRHDNVYAGIDFDLIVLNYGHNNQIGNAGISVSIRRNNLLYRNIEVVSQVIADQPQAEIALTLQNVDSDYPEFTIDQVEAVDKTARVLGCSTIDIRSAFQWKKFINPPASDWYRPSDNVHPNLIGGQVWRDIFIAGLLNPSKQALSTINPLAVLNDNLHDPFISYWNEDTQLPYFVSKEANAVATKDNTIFETGNSSLKLETNNSAKSWVTMNADEFLFSSNHEAGITLAVRVYVPLGVIDQDAGQVQISLSNGALLGSGYINTEVRDRWHWRLVHIPRSYVDAKYASSLNLIVNSSATNGEAIYIDRMAVSDGLLPNQPRLAGKYAPDYYFGGNVKALDGTALNTSTRNIEVTGDGGSLSLCAINFYGLEVGRSYTFTWDNPQTVTGTFSVRDVVDGVGSSLAAKDYTDAVKTIIWTATKTNGSVRCQGNNGQGVYNLSTLSIKPTEFTPA